MYTGSKGGDMPEESDQAIDLYIFRKAHGVFPEERWKWDWETWDPIIKQVYRGEVKAKDLLCPVCGQATLYDYYLIGHLRRNPEGSDERIFVGDCFIGCHSCKIQMRAYGEAPRWARETDIVWVSESARQRAEAEWLNVRKSAR